MAGIDIDRDGAPACRQHGFNDRKADTGRSTGDENCRLCGH
jgi:hypothetical protein